MESLQSDVDFGNSRSVSPIMDKLNQTTKPMKESKDLINKAPPAPLPQIAKVKPSTDKAASASPKKVPELKLIKTEIEKPQVKPQ